MTIQVLILFIYLLFIRSSSCIALCEIIFSHLLLQNNLSHSGVYIFDVLLYIRRTTQIFQSRLFWALLLNECLHIFRYRETTLRCIFRIIRFQHAPAGRNSTKQIDKGLRIKVIIHWTISIFISRNCPKTITRDCFYYLRPSTRNLTLNINP